MAIPNPSSMYGVCAKCGTRRPADQLVMVYSGISVQPICKDASGCSIAQAVAAARAHKWHGVYGSVTGRTGSSAPNTQSYWRHFDYEIYDDIFQDDPTPQPQRNIKPILMTVGNMIYVPIFRMTDEYLSNLTRNQSDEITKLLADIDAARQPDLNAASELVYFKAGTQPPSKTEKVNEMQWQNIVGMEQFFVFAIGVIKSGGAIIPVIKNGECTIEMWMPIEGQ